MPDNTKWIGLALLGALFAAIVQVTSKAALNAKQFDPATLNLIRAVVMTIAFVTLVGYGHFAGDSRDAGTTLTTSKLGDPAMLKAIGIGVLSGVAASASWYFGYRAVALADVSKTYPLDHLSVVIGVVLAALLFRERPGGWNWAGIALMVIGACLVTLPKGKGPAWALGGR